MSQRSLSKRLWYGVLHAICRVLGVVVFRVRCMGRHHIPRDGSALVLSNHQSHLDPVLIGIACNRRLNYLARDTLFLFAPLRWLISSLDAIPIDREGAGISGLKEMLRRLKRGEMVLIFPEGTRSHDGQLGLFKPGFSAVAKRSAAALVPVAIDGAFDAWPRQRKLPRAAAIRVQFGPPIAPYEVAAMDERELVAEVERRIAACLALARQRKVRTTTARRTT